MTNIDFNAATSAARYTFAGQDLPWLLAHWAEQTPDKVFLIWEHPDQPVQQWTYGQFWEQVRKVAAALAARGVKREDKVLLHSENCPEVVMAWYACAVLGAVGVTTNTRSVGDELAYFAEHAEVVGCITQVELLAAVSAAVPELPWCYACGEGVAEPALPFDQLLAAEPLTALREPEPMLPVGIQYTSGTTSRPKAVVHTHANALWGGQCGSANLGMSADDVYLCFLPFFHVNSQSWCFWSTLWVGGTVVLMPKFSASRFWEVSLRHRATRSSMIPFVLKAIGAQSVPEHQYISWSTGIVHPAVEQRFKVKTFATWGMTETVTHATRSVLGHKTPSGCIGHPSPGYEFAVIDAATGEYCDSEQIGDLYVRGVRGVQLFLEYYRNPEAMAKSFNADGWFATGDRVRLGADGYLYFADRDKDALKVGGENVSAAQIEQCILMALGPGVVDEVAVVAQPHSMLDEVPVVFAIRSPAAQEDEAAITAKITAACEQGLADFKRPRAIYWEQSLPRATLNKVAKNKLRERAAELAEG
jgi:crotonobetaine/carnitine-CoA ligase